MCAALRVDIRSEWDEAKQHDVLFLLTIRPPDATEIARMRSQGSQLNPMELYGLAYVRGLEVIEVKDEGVPYDLFCGSDLELTSVVCMLHSCVNICAPCLVSGCEVGSCTFTQGHFRL